MPDNHHSDRGVQHRDAFRRPVPKCYSRPGIPNAISESGIDGEGNAILIGLSITTCVAAFVIVYGGWSF
jgi:hypothetical protein